MADESVYGVAGVDSNKRKYDESPSPVARRATGFSSPPDSGAHPQSYNNVPPPMSEIEFKKQRAQEIASRLLNADPSKRARVENGAGIGGGGYEAVDAGSGHRHPGLGLSGPPPSASYGYTSSTSKKIEIPNGRVGVIIGKGGETIKFLQQQSGAKIQVTRDTDSDPNSTTRAVELMGTPDQIADAERMINDVLAEADTGGSGIVNRRHTGSATGAEQFVMQVANNKVGLVIGKGGETIKNMQAMTGARIQVIPLHPPPGDMSKERTVQIDGTSEQIEAAKRMVEEVTSENRMRNPSMTGGYSQQGYQSRPPTNWNQQGPPMQQSGYGYVQPGAYPGPPQYQQSNYPGYPPTSAGYATSWEQPTAPQNQQTTQGGGYDYYNQQQPSQQQQSQGGSTDYNYPQTQAYSQAQGYGQDGYYTATGQSGYGQPQTNPSSGYDQQQQQSYNTAYNVSNPAPDGSTPAYGTQTDTNQAPAQPSPNPSYPQQASTQPGYGAPPPQGGYGTQPPSGYGGYATPQGQKPSSQPAYAQPQQSPSAVPGGGYAQYSQAPPVQPGYAQTDAGAQRPPMSGYPVSQTGYGAPPYGAQTGYGQQQAQAYNSGYGAGYSQQAPPAYSSDTAAAAAPQPAGSAKASPPS